MAKKQDEPQVLKDYKTNIRNKSIREIVQEARKVTESPSEAPVTVKEEPKEEPKEEKAEVILDTPEHKELEEVRKTTEEMKKSQDQLIEEIKKIQESGKTKEEKKEEIKELKANWSGFDPKTGQKTPKDYDEIVGETVRLTKEQTIELLKQQFESFKEELKNQGKEEEAKKQEEQKQYQERLQTINKRIETEMDELYQLGKLKKPKNMQDKNDPDAQAVQELFDQAAAYNLEQQKQGKPLEDSIARFYFMRYQPKTKQPAGADAPVAGQVAATPQQDEKFDYGYIHNRSFRQIVADAKRKLTGK